MPVYIHDIATAVPDHSARQDDIRELMKEILGEDRKTRAIIHRIYSRSGIMKRHSVLEDFTPGDKGSLFFNGQLKSPPGTGQRNKRYEEEAPALFLSAGRQLLENNPEFSKEDITHVITVSCTGFYAPGPDFQVVNELGLKPGTERYHIGFMGCYAAFPAMKMARSFCTADPGNVVMIICVELCSLHFQYKAETDNLISASVFADGAAGALVSSRVPAEGGLQLNDFASSLATEGKTDMAWSVGDQGFDMILSSYVPDIIRRNLPELTGPLISKFNLTPDDIALWAIHPGGRAILDKLQQDLRLGDAQIQPSREVLAEYGNMSSATILFVLMRILSHPPGHGAVILPMAFGPGLTIETGLMTYHKS